MDGGDVVPANETLEKAPLAARLSVRIPTDLRVWLDAERGSIPREHYALALALWVGETYGGLLPKVKGQYPDGLKRYVGVPDGAPTREGPKQPWSGIIHVRPTEAQQELLRAWARPCNLSPHLWVRAALVEAKLQGLNVLGVRNAR